VYSWGSRGRDSLRSGLGKSSDDESNSEDDSDYADSCSPQLITALRGRRVQAIAASLERSCAVTDTGALYTWGRNTRGALGHGDVRYRERPALVTALHGIRVVGVSMHTEHTLALTADSSVYSVGEGAGLGISLEGENEEKDGSLLIPRKLANLTCMVPR
jgi:alpha-tubulin suppressor-like RCC1 family protein